MVKKDLEREARARGDRMRIAEEEQRLTALAVDAEEEDDGSGIQYRLRHALLARAVAEHRPISYVELGREAGLDDQVVSRYMTGRKKPAPHVIAKLARRLRCTAGWLLFGGSLGRPGTRALIEAPSDVPREVQGVRVAGGSKPRKKHGAGRARA